MENRYAILLGKSDLRFGATAEDAAALAQARLAKKTPSARTFTPIAVLDVKTMTIVGCVMMNGRYATRETTHGTTPDKLNFDFMTERYWHNTLRAVNDAAAVRDAILAD